MKRMLFNATHPEEIRVAIVDGQKLIDLDIETLGKEQRKGNIYKGVVTRVEPSLEAAFIDYSADRHGFLPFKEISRQYFPDGSDPGRARIQDILKEGQSIVVQVEKDERGNKGAALTTFISLAGRYIVLMPNNPRGGGVSRRVEGEERNELRDAIAQLEVPPGMSIIARTAGIGRTVEELNWDLNYLLQLWNAIAEASTPRYRYFEDVQETDDEGTTRTVKREVESEAPTGPNGKANELLNPAPYLIIEESSLVIRAIRDYFQNDIGEILIDNRNIFEHVRGFMSHVMPANVGRVKLYTDDVPLFSRFQIEHQIETAYARQVPLASGGAIVIDHTEALVAVDVNSARATKGQDIEATAVNTNLEAADEIARQLRLRDLGGLVVIDFIDMESAKNQRDVENRLRDALHYDRARVQMGKISRFGLMELSRQRLQTSLGESSHIACPRCHGIGHIRGIESTALHILRIVQEEAMKENSAAVHAQVPVEVATYLLNEKRSEFQALEAPLKVSILLIPNVHLETPNYTVTRLRHDELNQTGGLPPSYKMMEAPPEPETALPALNPVAPRNEPAVKGITPAQPAPAPAAPVAPEPRAVVAQPLVAREPSILQKIFGWFTGGKQEAPVAPPAALPASSETPRRPRGESRGESRGDGGRRPRQERGERGARADRPERGERADRGGDRTPRGERPDRSERGERTERPEARADRPAGEGQRRRGERRPQEPGPGAAPQVTGAVPESSEEAAATENRSRRNQRPPRQRDGQGPRRDEGQPRPERENREASAIEADSVEGQARPTQDAAGEAQGQPQEGRGRRRRGRRGDRSERSERSDQPPSALGEEHDILDEGPRPEATATSVAEPEAVRSSTPSESHVAVADAVREPSIDLHAAAADVEPEQPPAATPVAEPVSPPLAEVPVSAAYPVVGAEPPQVVEAEPLVIVETRPEPIPTPVPVVATPAAMETPPRPATPPPAALPVELPPGMVQIETRGDRAVPPAVAEPESVAPPRRARARAQPVEAPAEPLMQVETKR